MSTSNSTFWTIGPYQSALPGPIRLHLEVDGEVISSAKVETGFTHKGLEKTLELHSWQSAITYTDHLDPDSPFFGELVLCLTVEEIGQIAVPPRAQKIRIILSELSRISAHLNYIMKMAQAVGSEAMIHYVTRDREKILDLFELLTGARFSLNFLRFGGVASDISEGFVERVYEACDLMRLRLKEYNDLFSFNHAFLKRTAGIGVLSQDLAKAAGITGPNLRASGIDWDVRKMDPYCGFERCDFQIPIGKGEKGNVGDAHDRFLLHLREIITSIEILKQAADTVPAGEFSNGKVDKDFAVLAGEAYMHIESARGLLGCHVVSDGGIKPNRVQFRTPSLAILHVLPELLERTRIEDLPVILASLDFSVPEVDR